jgi:ADP-ribosylation factor-like protein 2
MGLLSILKKVGTTQKGLQVTTRDRLRMHLYNAASCRLTHDPFTRRRRLTKLQVKAKEREIRLLVLGLDNAGKTTVLRKFCGEPIDTIEPTLGFNIKSLEHKGFILNFWDVGGQKTIRSYWRNYFEKTDGLIWVVDSTDRDRLKDCKKELFDLVGEEKMAGCSILVLANKQDLANAMSTSEMEALLELRTSERFAKRHWSIHACSAVNGAGLADGVDWIVDDISSRIFNLS